MKAVKTLRLLLNVPQAQLAEAAGISARELSRIEKAQVYPSRETMGRIDDAFDEVLKERWTTPSDPTIT